MILKNKRIGAKILIILFLFCTIHTEYLRNESHAEVATLTTAGLTYLALGLIASYCVYTNRTEIAESMYNVQNKIDSKIKDVLDGNLSEYAVMASQVVAMKLLDKVLTGSSIETISANDIGVSDSEFATAKSTVQTIIEDGKLTYAESMEIGMKEIYLASINEFIAPTNEIVEELTQDTASYSIGLNKMIVPVEPLMSHDFLSFGTGEPVIVNVSAEPWSVYGFNNAYRVTYQINMPTIDASGRFVFEIGATPILINGVEYFKPSYSNRCEELYIDITKGNERAYGTIITNWQGESMNLDKANYDFFMSPMKTMFPDYNTNIWGEAEPDILALSSAIGEIWTGQATFGGTIPVDLTVVDEFVITDLQSAVSVTGENKYTTLFAQVTSATTTLDLTQDIPTDETDTGTNTGTADLTQVEEGIGTIQTTLQAIQDYVGTISTTLNPDPNEMQEEDLTSYGLPNFFQLLVLILIAMLMYMLKLFQFVVALRNVQTDSTLLNENTIATIEFIKSYEVVTGLTLFGMIVSVIGIIFFITLARVVTGRTTITTYINKIPKGEDR